MTLRGLLRRGVGVWLVLAAVLLPGAEGALANSGSLSVANAGGGSMSVTAEATLSQCDATLCSWYAAVRERHSSLPCANDRVFRVGIVGFATQPGTMRQTLNFKPFFPRTAKLCLYEESPLGQGSELLAELTYRVPKGYGFGRSKRHSCADFSSQAAAQYYFYLYPDDPSGLDPDRNGVACEGNPCPCKAEPIPAEPIVARIACRKAHARQRQASRAVAVAQRRLRKATHPAALRRWGHELKARRGALRNAKRRARKACRPAAARPDPIAGAG
jgi:hypothetical protein